MSYLFIRFTNDRDDITAVKEGERKRERDKSDCKREYKKLEDKSTTEFFVCVNPS